MRRGEHAPAGDPCDGLRRADFERDVADALRKRPWCATPERQIRAAVEVHETGVPLRQAHRLQEESVVGDFVAVGDGVQGGPPLDPAVRRRPRCDPVALIRHAPRPVEVESETTGVVQRDETIVPVEHQREAGLVRGIHDAAVGRAVVAAAAAGRHPLAPPARDRHRSTDRPGMPASSSCAPEGDRYRNLTRRAEAGGAAPARLRAAPSARGHRPPGRHYLNTLAAVLAYAQDVGLLEAAPIVAFREQLRRRRRTKRRRALTGCAASAGTPSPTRWW